MKFSQWIILGFVLLISLELIFAPEVEAWGRRRRRWSSRRRRWVSRRRRWGSRRRSWTSRRRRVARQRRSWLSRRRRRSSRRRSNWFRKGIRAIGRGFKKAGKAIKRGFKVVGKAVWKGINSKVGRWINTGVSIVNGVVGNLCCAAAAAPPGAVCCGITRGVAGIQCAIKGANTAHQIINKKVVGALSDAAGTGSACFQAATGFTPFNRLDKKFGISKKATGILKKGGRKIVRGFKKAGGWIARKWRGKRDVSSTSTAGVKRVVHIRKSLAARHLPSDASALQLMVYSMERLHDFCKLRSQNKHINRLFYEAIIGGKRNLENLRESGSKRVAEAIAATNRLQARKLWSCSCSPPARRHPKLFHSVREESYINTLVGQPCRLHPPIKKTDRFAFQYEILRRRNEPSPLGSQYCAYHQLIGVSHLVRIVGYIQGDLLAMFKVKFSKKRLKIVSNLAAKPPIKEKYRDIVARKMVKVASRKTSKEA